MWWIIHAHRVSLTSSALFLHVRFKVFDVLSSHWGARHCKYSCICSCTELWFSRLINRRDQDSEEHGNATEQGVSHVISKSYIHPDIHFKNELLVQWKSTLLRSTVSPQRGQIFPLAQLWKGQFTTKCKFSLYLCSSSQNENVSFTKSHVIQNIQDFHSSSKHKLIYFMPPSKINSTKNIDVSKSPLKIFNVCVWIKWFIDE